MRNVQSSFCSLPDISLKKMPILCVIGAGAAGVGVARRLTEAGMEYQVYEQTDSIGGTWVYDERIGYEKYSYPIHTSMYENLRTNLPKEVMAFPDYPIENKKSYVKSEVILNYLRNYARANDVMKNIFFLHRVLQVDPNPKDGWDVKVRNLITNETTIKKFDVVLVCNGHYHTPFTSLITGQNTFPGKIIHSHDFRKPKPFKDKIVVVIGGGPSGFDIALNISSEAKEVYMSHHSKDPFLSSVPENYIVKPDISEISGKVVSFVDGSSAVADALILCTGFSYNFPFLSDECGIKVENNQVYPLYKHMIHIENPTLCFIGLPFYVCANLMFDLQIRYYIKFLQGGLSIPDKEGMYKLLAEDLDKRKSLGFGKRDAHKLGDLQATYFKDLAAEAGIPGVPPVMANLHAESSRRFMDDLQHFRDEDFDILDDQTFIKRKD